MLRSAVVALSVAGLIVEGRAEPLTIDVERLLGVASFYFGKQAQRGRAVLVNNNDGDADLLIYLEDRNASGVNRPMKLAVNKKAVAFHGAMGGMGASISGNGGHSFAVHSENIGVGRNKWEKKITIGERDGGFAVIGFTYKSFDGLDPKAGGSCDLNLGTGRGKRNGKDVSFSPAPIKLADWSDERTPKECKF